MEPHIGKLIEQEIQKQGISKSEFARRLCCTRMNVYLILEKENIDAEMLLRVSKVLGVDLFAKLSEANHESIVSR